MWVLPWVGGCVGALVALLILKAYWVPLWGWMAGVSLALPPFVFVMGFGALCFLGWWLGAGIAGIMLWSTRRDHTKAFFYVPERRKPAPRRFKFQELSS